VAIVLLGMLTGWLIHTIRERYRKMALLTAQQIFDADDSKHEDVPCPEWGGEVRIRNLSGSGRDSYEASIVQAGGSGDRKVDLRNARVKLIVRCAVNEDGSKMFTAEDINRLGRKNAAPIDRLFDAARRLSGMAEGDVERMVENLNDDPNDEATSD
jgi:hypothetical protein